MKLPHRIVFVTALVAAVLGMSATNAPANAAHRHAHTSTTHHGVWNTRQSVMSTSCSATHTVDLNGKLSNLYTGSGHGILVTMTRINSDGTDGESSPVLLVPAMSVSYPVVHTSLTVLPAGQVRFDKTWANGAEGSDYSFERFGPTDCSVVTPPPPPPPVTPPVTPPAVVKIVKTSLHSSCVTAHYGEFVANFKNSGRSTVKVKATVVIGGQTGYRFVLVPGARYRLPVTGVRVGMLVQLTVDHKVAAHGRIPSGCAPTPPVTPGGLRQSAPRGAAVG